MFYRVFHLVENSVWYVAVFLNSTHLHFSQDNILRKSFCLFLSTSLKSKAYILFIFILDYDSACLSVCLCIWAGAFILLPFQSDTLDTLVHQMWPWLFLKNYRDCACGFIGKFAVIKYNQLMLKIISINGKSHFYQLATAPSTVLHFQVMLSSSGIGQIGPHLIETLRNLPIQMSFSH